jgi:hypothetical protein
MFGTLIQIAFGVAKMSHSSEQERELFAPTSDVTSDFRGFFRVHSATCRRVTSLRRSTEASARPCSAAFRDL